MQTTETKEGSNWVENGSSSGETTETGSNRVENENGSGETTETGSNRVESGSGSGEMNVDSAETNDTINSSENTGSSLKLITTKDTSLQLVYAILAVFLSFLLSICGVVLVFISVIYLLGK